MQVGMVGLGRMGANLVRRLRLDDHHCVVFDVDPLAVQMLVGEGAVGAHTLAELVNLLDRPRTVWLMLPSAVVTGALSELVTRLEPGDTVIDGGNSYYRDSITRVAELARHQLHYVDCGTSGGVLGVERGFCLMIGGEADVVTRLEPIFAGLAPGPAGVEPTPGRTRTDSTAPAGYLHCGPAGAGHFVKMVHNGIEYAMMAALAEGFNILHHADVGKNQPIADAEAPLLRDPQAYQYDIDVAEVAELWRRGSVVSSWLLDLLASALARSPRLEEFTGRVGDSGEGRWTVAAAVDEGVPAPAITAALYQRFASRGAGEFAHRILSAMRREFGGHTDG